MPAFPSVDWLTEVARLAMQDETYRKFGRVDATVGLKVGERVFRLTFDVFDIRDIHEIDANDLGAQAMTGLEDVPSDLQGSAAYRQRVGAAMVARAFEAARNEARGEADDG